MMKWPPQVMEPPPRSTEYRDRVAKHLWPMFFVPRCVDDPEIMAFLERHFLMFNPKKSVMTAGQLVDAACEKFGRIRCGSLEFWEH